MKSKTNLFKIKKIDQLYINKLVSKREGETKLGENINFDLKSSKCKFVILGISEDIGPQSNFGQSGSNNNFETFLVRLVNTQSNRFLNGEEIFILGEIKQQNEFENIETGRKQIEYLDEYIEEIISPIVKEGKIPIVIGGGHNNAYPLIKSCFKNSNKQIDVINLDPHADCRALEGRHSGNSFSYAKENGFLNQYSVLGLHEQYNSEFIINYLEKNKFYFTFFEDYLDKKKSIQEDLTTIISLRDKNRGLGVELDLDSIAMMPTSAFTPSGFSIEEARIYLRELAKQKDIVYLHLTEGSPKSETENKVVGKSLTYFVLDFIKENLKNN